MNQSLITSKASKVFKKYPIAGAYFYGSKLNGKPSALSDLDIGILLKEKVSSRRYFTLRLEIQDALGRVLKDQRIDLAILNQASPLLAQSVVTKGRLIFCSDKDKIANFACQTLRRYDDALFLRETYYQYLKKRALEGKLGEVER